MVFGTAVVEGTSMQPTLRSHDYVLVNKYTLAWGGLRRGDVIFLRWDGEDSESKDDIVVKRVVGLPGDQVEIRGGQVYLNREILDEPYVDNKMGGENFSYVVPEDSVFVMGDNRGNSEDSRDRGPVSMRNIIGKAACVIWPLRRLGKI
jgi:signal peptidase I